jgi:hypothetical protein
MQLNVYNGLSYDLNFTKGMPVEDFQAFQLSEGVNEVVKNVICFDTRT